MSNEKTPVALTIAGSDSSGGAGIQADIKTFSALGVYGASVITALTAQNTQGVQAVHVPPVECVIDQLSSVFSDLNVGAVKIGMLATEETIVAVSNCLEEYCEIPVVLDPVMISTSGDRLLDEDAEDSLINLLVPQATLITPNLIEAAHLLDDEIAEDEEDIRDQLEDLLEMGPEAVLLKGGHAEGAEAVDYFQLIEEAPARHSTPRLDTPNTHGTGCTLSSAICAYLVLGYELHDAIIKSKIYLTEALHSADDLKIGAGHGPVHHFYDFWD